MDEPFSKLDQLTARKLREDTLSICARLKQTTLLVTHDVEEGAFMGDRIIVFSARPARVIEIIDNPSILRRETWTITDSSNSKRNCSSWCYKQPHRRTKHESTLHFVF